MATLQAPRPSAQPRKPRRKPSRGVTLEGDRLTLRVGTKAVTYACREVVCGSGWDGRGFRLTKPDGDTHDVFLARNGQDDLCGCRGFEAHGHCKHRDGLKALLSLGRLDEQPEPAANDLFSERVDAIEANAATLAKWVADVTAGWVGTANLDCF